MALNFEAMTIEKLINLVFTEMVYCKIQQLEKATLSKKDEIGGDQWTKFRKRFEVFDEEEGWIRYAEHALELLNHDVIWQGIIEACKIRKYPELSEIHRDHFEALFNVSCFVCFQCFLKLKEHCLLTILLTILSLCVNLNTTQLYDVLDKTLYLNIKLKSKNPLEGQIVFRKSRFGNTSPSAHLSSHDYGPRWS